MHTRLLEFGDSKLFAGSRGPRCVAPAFDLRGKGCNGGCRKSAAALASGTEYTTTPSLKGCASPGPWLVFVGRVDASSCPGELQSTLRTQHYSRFTNSQEFIKFTNRRGGGNGGVCAPVSSGDDKGP